MAVNDDDEEESKYNEILQLMDELVGQMEGNLLDPQPWELQESYLQQQPMVPMVPPMDHLHENWSDKWPDWDKAGEGHDTAWFTNFDDRKHYCNLLRAHGYKITEPIRYSEGAHDHQIYEVETIPVQPNDPKNVYVCKIVSMGYYKQKFDDINESVLAFRKETAILLRLKHKNIITIVDSIELKDRQTNFPYNYGALIMEQMEGTLNGFRKESPLELLTEEESQVWVRDIANALKYLHSMSKQETNDEDEIVGYTQYYTVVHMALTPRNILFNRLYDKKTDTFIRFQFKLADFEECYIYERHEQVVMPDWALAKPYTHRQSAPELKEATSDLDTRPMDMFSLGACIHYMFTGKGGEFTDEKFEKQAHIYPPLMAQFVRQLTDLVPSNRLTATEALEHPWLNTG